MRREEGKAQLNSIWRMDLEGIVADIFSVSGYFFQDHLKGDIGGWI
jgi:hypothetical protein